MTRHLAAPDRLKAAMSPADGRAQPVTPPTPPRAVTDAVGPQHGPPLPTLAERRAAQPRLNPGRTTR